MFKSLVKNLGLDPTQRDLKRYGDVARAITAREPEFAALSDAELRAQTDKFKATLAQATTGLGGDARRKAEEKALNEILPDAFGVVREAAKRTLGMRHYDVQLIGGQVLHEGRAAEMRTGEGKTLVATLPLYLNALAGHGAHLVTVNDYLAQRDAVWMGPIFHFLGLSVGILQAAFKTDNARKAYIYDPEKPDGVRLVDRWEAYAADITYGTNNEFGFDYLRDNMAMRLRDRRQRALHYAIIDEVDNVLIDQARTPLIISGPANEATDLYVKLAQVVKQLTPELYEIDERNRSISLTDEGYEKVEDLLGQPLRDPDRPEDLSPEQAQLVSHLEQALRAEFLYHKNKDYIIQARKVVIVDQQTGRAMPGRRWSDGLHQAVEAKEGVKIESENVTYASITLQNYFRMYKKLAGMSGTVLTEAEEFKEIYKIDVIPVPTKLDWEVEHDPTLVLTTYKEGGQKFEKVVRKDNPNVAVLYRRKDYDDLIFRSEEAKLRNMMIEVLSRHVKGQPLLLGTTSVDLSEKISGRLRAEPLRRLALVLLLRDIWFEQNHREQDGRAVPELEFLNEPLESLNDGKLRPLARELNVRLNPTVDENLNRLMTILGIDDDEAQQAQYRERLALILDAGINHQVLNAKEHERESELIAAAGKPYAVTVATNMAGRGVDIKLGGELPEEVHQTIYKILQRVGVPRINQVIQRREPYRTLSEVDNKAALEIFAALEAQGGLQNLTLTQQEALDEFRAYMDRYALVHSLGGLHVIGSERHEARRIDNQLRGRAGRQGDIGSSRFYLSLQDELMRRFGGGNVADLMERFKIDEMLPMEHNLVTRVVEQSQTRVEGANFDMRKHVLEYDDVLNEQRQRVYEQRDRILTKADITDDLQDLIDGEIEFRVTEARNRGEGWWPLLDWVDKLQPPIIQSPKGGQPLFSFSLELVLRQLEGLNDVAAVRAKLMEIARGATAAANDQIHKQVDKALTGLRDRAKNFAASRREEVEMAYEGKLEEARENDTELDSYNLARELLEVAHLNARQVDIRQMSNLPARKVRDIIADLAEADGGLKVIQAWLAGYRRRTGLALQVEVPEWKALNWNHFERDILDAVDDEREQATQKTLGELQNLVNEKLTTPDQLNHEYLGRLLGEMSISRMVGIDRRTFKVVRLQNQRFPYIYYAAALMANDTPEKVINQVDAHFAKARGYYAEMFGADEISRLSRNTLSALEEEVRNRVCTALGHDIYHDYEGVMIADLPDTVRDKLTDVLGQYRLMEIYREVALRVITGAWVEYLTTIEAVRTSAGLEAYAQRDPLVAYKSRAFDEFQTLLRNIRAGVVNQLFRYQPRTSETGQVAVDREASAAAQQRRSIGRNDPCWCGSGKKYKNCHMQSDLKGGKAEAPAVAASKS
mgnify:CR=1 FL=1